MKKLMLTMMILVLSFLVKTYAQNGQGTASQKFTDWSTPVNLGPTINSTANEVAPALSRDGRSLYFTSTRSGFGGEDIWVSRRTSRNDVWAEPVNLGPIINTGANERLRAISANGHTLLFQSDRPGGLGGSDIWASRRRGINDNDGWETPVNLGPTINTSANELGATFLLENQGINNRLYFSSGRREGLGGADFYSSEILEDGTFSPAVNIVELNSAFNDSCSSIRSDGLEIVFTSTRPDPLNAAGSNDLWTSTRDTIFDPWSPPVNLGSTVNSAGSIDAHPALSSDGRTLIFTSNRPGGFGGTDLYMTTRELRRKNGK